MPYNFAIVVQPEGNNICKYYSLFVNPYYTVINGINQVNNYGRNPPKTRVKQKISFLLLKLSTGYIDKSSTSFHPVDLMRTFVALRSHLNKEEQSGN